MEQANSSEARTGSIGRETSKRFGSIGGEVLLVSQFTLYFRMKGPNLDFSKSMPPDAARQCYQVTGPQALLAHHVQEFVGKVREEMGDPEKVSVALFEVFTLSPNPHRAVFAGPRWAIWRYDGRGAGE
eukprot:2309665-Rhodomonas_salina.2